MQQASRRLLGTQYWSTALSLGLPASVPNAVLFPQESFKAVATCKLESSSISPMNMEILSL